MSKENKMIKKFILTSLTIGGVITALFFIVKTFIVKS
jgi:hypothetical protein